MYRIATKFLARTLDLRACGDDERAFVLLRVGLSCVLLFKLLYELPDFGDLYGPYGLVPWWANEISAPGHVPTLGWLYSGVNFFVRSVRPEVVAAGVLGMYAGALVLLLLGRWQRFVAVIACLTHFALLASNRFTLYGADAFASIGLFYLALGPSTASRRQPRRAGGYWTLLLMTLLRLQLSVVYAQAGWTKFSGAEWWSGNSLWRALRQPQFQGIVGTQWLGSFPALVKSLAICVILVESAYPFAIWVRKVRVLAVSSIVVLHAMIMVTLALWAFGAVMIVLNLTAFGIPVLQDLRPLVPDGVWQKAFPMVPETTLTGR